jgi:hypothetical protein
MLHTPNFRLGVARMTQHISSLLANFDTINDAIEEAERLRGKYLQEAVTIAEIYGIHHGYHIVACC